MNTINPIVNPIVNPNPTIAERLKTLVQEERKMTKEILLLLCEVDEKRIYAEMGYGSLFDFCSGYLGYSEGSTSRRVNAARLLKRAPEIIAEKIESGELTLSTASQIHTFSRQENKTSMEALELVDLLSNKSQREVERILIEKAPEKLKRETIKVKTKNISELRVNITQECEKNIEKLKAYSAHRNMSLGELIGELIQKEIEKIEKDKFGKSHGAKQAQEKTIEKNDRVAVETSAPQNSTPAPALKTWRNELTSKRAKIPKFISREIYKKAQGACQYTDPKTGKKCGSNYFLQIEHKIPLAKQGTNHHTNLELLCRAHNLLRRDQQGLTMDLPSKESK